MNWVWHLCEASISDRSKASPLQTYIALVHTFVCICVHSALVSICTPRAETARNLRVRRCR